MAQRLGGQPDGGGDQPGEDHQEKDRRAVDELAVGRALKDAAKEDAQPVVGAGGVGRVDIDEGQKDQQVGHHRRGQERHVQRGTAWPALGLTLGPPFLALAAGDRRFRRTGSASGSSAVSAISPGTTGPAACRPP